MNDVASTQIELPAAIEPLASWRDPRYLRPLIVLVAALLLFATAMARSFYDGRLAAPMTHNDVNYFIFGLQRLALLRTEGFRPFIEDFIFGSTHAPITSYQAVLAYQTLGIHDWAPYATNIAYATIFLAFAAYLVRDCPPLVLAAVMACLLGMPIASIIVTEFAPETVCSLFTAMGAVLLVRLPVLDAPLRSRFIAGLCFGVGFLAQPVAFPFTTIVLLATVGIAFLRDAVWPWNPGKWKTGILKSLFNILLSIWLPALYMVPRYDEYWQYFAEAMTNPLWQSKLGLRDQIEYYLSGFGGVAMFGAHGKVWVFAAIIGLGIVAAWWRGDRPEVARQLELLPLAALLWLVPTLAPSKTHLFGLAFGFLVAFMTVMALRSLYRSMPGRTAAIALAAIGLLLVVSNTAYLHIANTPRTIVDRAFAFGAIDRFQETLLGDAADSRAAKVYMTNIGAFAPNILQYYLLKVDPTLDWTFDSKWTDPNPRDHIDYINSWRPDFVIAGQRGNGLTYSGFAQPAEDAVFEAMSRNPAYMAIDRFYGPGGREIAIFQRRGNFAGWRPVSGVADPTGRRDDPRTIPNGLAYLQTYSTRAVEADLEIEWAGAAAVQTLDIFVNQQKPIELRLDPQAGSSSLRQRISLTRGDNDIVLQSDHALTLRYLVIAPRIGAAPADQGIAVTSATYGANCGAPAGNATQDVAASCDGKTECAYKVDVNHLGDPAQNCGKNFAVSYFCPSEATARHGEVPGEAGFGSVLTLSCAPPERD